MFTWGGDYMDNGASSYRRYLDGDEKAFDEIIKELFNNVVFFVNGYLHDIHTAEDIAIDVFSELISNKNKYNFKVSLKTYLFMLARSRALNFIKRKKIITFVELEKADEYEHTRYSIEEAVLRDERKKVINKALSGLSDDMRVAVHLVYFEDMSYDEAARVMKKNTKQIDNLLYRAKGELRNIIRREGLNYDEF